MAKVISPLFSLDASGTIGDAIVFSKWKGRNYVRQYVIPSYSNTTEQSKLRQLVTDASRAWKLGSTIGGVEIDADYKLAYNDAAVPSQISGFNLFIKECVALNNAGAYDLSLSVPASPGL